MGLLDARHSSMALSDTGRPTSNGTTMRGKITESRTGSNGRRGVFSVVFFIIEPESPRRRFLSRRASGTGKTLPLFP
jgi:hypothetical protein